MSGGVQLDGAEVMGKVVWLVMAVGVLWVLIILLSSMSSRDVDAGIFVGPDNSATLEVAPRDSTFILPEWFFEPDIQWEDYTVCSIKIKPLTLILEEPIQVYQTGDTTLEFYSFSTGENIIVDLAEVFIERPACSVLEEE
ncbi:MAG: hypothetical protein ACXABY_01375 [Candidatus Thorarchaeota archaeon]|jgi:hypothetical protein